MQKNVTNNNSDKTKLPLSDRIRLNSPVTSIVWNDGSEQVKVTAGNVVYTADLVLVTVSLGVLKDKADSMFIPKLPDATRRAISVSWCIHNFKKIKSLVIPFLGTWLWEDWQDLPRV